MLNGMFMSRGDINPIHESKLPSRHQEDFPPSLDPIMMPVGHYPSLCLAQEAIYD